MKKRGTLLIAQAAVIAALYVILTFVANAFGLANYAIQVRFSEALTILPFFTPAAIPGLFVGCLLSNILTGCAMWDVLFGSLATLIGAFGTYFIGKIKWKGAPWLTPIPPIAANVAIVPFILEKVYMLEGSVNLFGLNIEGLNFFQLTVGAGEVISCGILGLILLFALKPHRDKIFK